MKFVKSIRINRSILGKPYLPNHLPRHVRLLDPHDVDNYTARLTNMHSSHSIRSPGLFVVC